MPQTLSDTSKIHNKLLFRFLEYYAWSLLVLLLLCLPYVFVFCAWVPVPVCLSSQHYSYLILSSTSNATEHRTSNTEDGTVQRATHVYWEWGPAEVTSEEPFFPRGQSEMIVRGCEK